MLFPFRPTRSADVRSASCRERRFLHAKCRPVYDRGMARRRLYPMPVEGFLDHPDFVAMPAAARGILFTLSLHFWQTECRPLPKSDIDKRHIGRAHGPTWSHWRVQILRVFEAVRPALEAYYGLRESHGTTIRFAGQRGGQTSAAKLRHKTLAAKAEAEMALSRVNATPQRLPNRPDRPLLPDERPPRTRVAPSRLS
jgi:hypothetical protein